MNSTLAKNRFILTLSLILLLLASCTPAAVAPEESSAQAPVAPPVSVEPSATPFLPADPAVAPPTDVVVAPTEAVAPHPVATSRGDALHATDPRTVNLASGGIQFVEFFRFT